MGAFALLFQVGFFFLVGCFLVVGFFDFCWGFFGGFLVFCWVFLGEGRGVLLGFLVCWGF